MEPSLVFVSVCLGGLEAKIAGGECDAGDNVGFVDEDSDDFLRISRSESRAVGLSSVV